MYDHQENKPIADYKIDIKIRSDKKEEKYLADAVYYFDPKYQILDDDGHERVDKAAYQDPEYQNLVKKTARSLLEQCKPRLRF